MERDFERLLANERSMHYVRSHLLLFVGSSSVHYAGEDQTERSGERTWGTRWPRQS